MNACSTRPTRRSVAFGLCSMLVSWPGLQSRAAAEGIFCGFSLTGGWQSRGGTRIIARVAGANDASGVPQVIDRIEKALNVETGIRVLVATSRQGNAFATLSAGRRLIVVDLDFLDRVNAKGESDWAAIQVIAHEVGHFVAGFSSNRHVNETNADYWSGLILQRLGASRTASSSALRAFGSESASSSHPSERVRIAALEKGWDDGRSGRVDYSHCIRCNPK